MITLCVTYGFSRFPRIKNEVAVSGERNGQELVAIAFVKELALGRVADRVVVIDGQACVAKTFNLSMSYNRLLLHGKTATLLISRIREIFETQSFKTELQRGSTGAEKMLSAPASSQIPSLK